MKVRNKGWSYCEWCEVPVDGGASLCEDCAERTRTAEARWDRLEDEGYL